MRIHRLAAVAAIALTAAACGGQSRKNQVTTEMNLADDTAVNDMLGANLATENEGAVALPTDANGFATALAASDLYEIESSRLAAERANSAEVKAAAQRIRTDHEKSSQQLQALIQKAGMSLTPALDAEKQGMLNELKTATGADFDRLFLDQQTRAHQKALQLLQSYAGSGDNQQLKDFASDGAKMVQGHLEHLNGIRQ